MSAFVILLTILGYFVLIFIISLFTGRHATNISFFLGDKKSKWYVVAFGMIGASLSGVTFISVPGWVYSSQFSYMQMVLGYLLGYFVIANILLPLYYRLQLTSIYTFLLKRFGKISYQTGSSCFLISRLIGASFRLFLVANVLQITVFNDFGVPFYLTVIITVVLIWFYTFRGGIKTIIWTDTLQTAFMLSSVIITIILISRDLTFSFGDLSKRIIDSNYSRIFFLDDWKSKYFFLKQFLGGVFITIVMTGLDQDMMQKNLSCRNIREAKKNMYWFSITLVPVNLIFLALGAILFIYASSHNITIPAYTDDIFPMVITSGYLKPVLVLLFILGLISAAYSSADSALTSLTTSFTIDILRADRKSEKQLKRTRIISHVLISVMLLFVILLFKAINDQNVISALFTMAGYTYGPLLGLFTFGLITSRRLYEPAVPIVAIASPLICYFISVNSVKWLNGYTFGFELLILNGLITFLGLFLISRKGKSSKVILESN